MKYEVEPGTGKYRNATITFAARKGKSVDLQKLHKAIRATRLGGKTRSAVNYLEITAEGEVVVVEKDMLFKVSGAAQQFTLGDDPKAKPREGTKTPHQRLKDALAKGAKITSVTGRVRGWSGRWPAALRERECGSGTDEEKPEEAGTKKPTLLTDTDFESRE